MNDFEQPPLVFANHVLKQVIGHLFGEELIIDKKDYMSIRSVYRALGGSWSRLASGDIIMLELLKKVVTAWGQMPERKTVENEVI